MAWAPDYVTSADLKAYLRITDTVDDAQIAQAITAASRAVDQCTNRQFGLTATTEARAYTARYDRHRCRWTFDIDDLMSPQVTGLSLSTVAGSIDQFSLQPFNNTFQGLPYTRVVVKPESTVKPNWLEDGVTATAKWGWTTVPLAVQQATLLQAARFHTRRQAPFGVAGSPDQGSELRLLARVDPDVEVVLAPYRRWWGAVGQNYTTATGGWVW